MSKNMALILFVCVVPAVVVLFTSPAVPAADPIDTSPTTPAASSEERVYPIAPGIWYPQDGALPERPVRYYRVRCWPGCHSGSPHGKYPDRTLREGPIFPTSTVPGTGSAAD